MVRVSTCNRGHDHLYTVFVLSDGLYCQYIGYNMVYSGLKMGSSDAISSAVAILSTVTIVTVLGCQGVIKGAALLKVEIDSFYQTCWCRSRHAGAEISSQYQRALCQYVTKLQLVTTIENCWCCHTVANTNTTHSISQNATIEKVINN